MLAVLFLVLPLLVTPSPLLEVARQHQLWLWTYTTNFYIGATSSWASLTYVSHFWSLAIEEHFYLFWPLVVFAFRRPALERICLGVLAGGLALRIGLALSGVSELSISVLTPCRIDTLCVGCLLALLVRREGGTQRWVEPAGRVALGLGAAIVLLSAFCATAKWGLPVLHQVRNSLYAFFFGALTLTSLKPPANLVARALSGTTAAVLRKVQLRPLRLPRPLHLVSPRDRGGCATGRAPGKPLPGHRRPGGARGGSLPGGGRPQLSAAGEALSGPQEVLRSARRSGRDARTGRLLRAGAQSEQSTAPMRRLRPTNSTVR